MLIALAFTHFSSELLLKQRNRLFLLIVSWRTFPPKFPAKSADFSANFDFSPVKSADCSANFDCFLAKIREIGRFFREFAPENPAKFCFFFREISEALII